MIRRFWLAALVAGLCVSETTAQGIVADQSGHLPFIMLASTPAPIGARQFCKSWPAECAPVAPPDAPVLLPGARLAQLTAVNDAWNRNIVPVTDADYYNVIELWTYPDGFGDCEDYALAKRRALVELGWPAGALLMALVRQQNGDGHAVLVAVTSAGDLVLDNLVPDIRAWDQTDYRFIKVQTPVSLDQWVGVDDP